MSDTVSWTWGIGWVLLIGLALAWEGAALANKRPGDTLSEHVWRVLKVGAAADGKPSVITWSLRVLIALFLLWLLFHFLFGWFTPSDPVPW